MSINLHTISFVEGGANQARADRLLAGVITGLAYGAGGGVGAPVVVPVTALKGLPAKYAVLVSPDQDVTWFVMKTSTGFNITLTPRLAGSTLVAGTVDVMVFA